MEDLHSVLHSPNKEAVRFLLEQTLIKWEKNALEAMEILEEGFEYELTVLDWPKFRT